jgi:hypothetical protein
MSFKLSVAWNSLGIGGVVLGAVAGAAIVGAIEGAVDGAAAAGAGEPVGGGALAAVVAGRFGHPTRKRERTSTGTASSALPRCAMSQILLIVFIICVVVIVPYRRYISPLFGPPEHPITEGAVTKLHL